MALILFDLSSDIPAFAKYAKIDPNFAVLVTPNNFGTTTSESGRNESGNLKPGVIAVS